MTDRIPPKGFLPECIHQMFNRNETLCNDSKNECYTKACSKRCETPTKGICDWQLDPDNDTADVYETSCKNAWEFTEGNLKDNEISFCPYCGKRIEEIFND